MQEQQLFDEVLKMPPLARANFAEKILESLQETDAALSEQWKEEVESRLKAYDDGLIEAIPAEKVFAKYRMKCE